MHRKFRLTSVASLLFAIAFPSATCQPAFAEQDVFDGAQPVAEPQLIPAQTTEFAPLEPIAPAAVAEELAPPVEDGVVVHPVTKLDYHVSRRARRAFANANFVELMMVTQNPADGCFYEIPLCVPECCLGEPQVTSYCGLLGRGVVQYCYACGLEVEVIFRLRGDVKVEYGM